MTVASLSEGPARPPAVRVERLGHVYSDGFKALDGVSFTVAAGERVALLGPNGAGKSTLLLRLNGLLNAGGGGRGESGVGRGGGGGGGGGLVEIGGVVVEKRNLREIRRRVGVLFQNPDDQLFCASVFDDVAFGPRHLDLPEDEVRRRVAETMHAVGRAGVGERSPRRLSFGDKKRVALAAVLAMHPEVLALDEPTAALDPRGRREIIELLLRLGGTQIIATHDLEAAKALCPRALVLSAGHLVADGETAALLSDFAFLKAHGLA